ncbi:hypothetical protein ABENE_11445 [Asticcacaulis benevestitus DSM 16100 = ATCC BAA-896]|uniref:Uncharacterized protein n=1 Tax=Asticcacaulis benevestitus DSM 16100 = ATCC BAA-896 TaxID=1121022 RepID=V4PAE6_9CAUL|nr:hypothetical protein ABENE_11445 [Asticcacaulis benevestitus DSM 16100 = ATCC BAA-896]
MEAVHNLGKLGIGKVYQGVILMKGQMMAARKVTECAA